MKRRTFVQAMPGAALALQAQTATTSLSAKLKPRASTEIAASPLSIGFEALDRKLFDPEKTYPHLEKLGVKWARCQTGWGRTETRKGEYDFKWLEDAVASLLKIGIQPWFSLGYGNKLYTPGAKDESAAGFAPLNSEEAKRAWVEYVTALTDRFGSRVRHWEVWHEPNQEAFWQPGKPDPARYLELVWLTAPVLRQRITGVVVIGGAYAGLSDLDFVERCFEAGMGNLVDKVSYHPYRAVPEENYDADVRALRGIIARYKPGIAIWQGENGAPSTANSAGALRELLWDETRQAKWLLRRLLTDLALNVELTSYFHAVDLAEPGAGAATNSKGILRAKTYAPKPSYEALQNLCAIVDSDLKRTDFLVRAGGPALDAMALRTASFVKKDRPVYAWWNPASLQKGFVPQKARLTVWSGKPAKLDRAVIVDLLNGTITAAPAPSRTAGLDTFDVPVRDYPMLLTDSSLLP